jgi:hypothetical protein
MEYPTIIDAIRAIKSDIAVTIRGTDITWDDGNPTDITQQQIDAKLVELMNDWTAQEYARNRKAEYDALNQFEMISDDTINGTTTHKDAILAIKAKYPKPE